MTHALLVAAFVLLRLWALLVLTLVLAGRGADARALARFIPDCLVLLRRLLGDARVPRRHKALLLALAGYLAMPIDLVPDFIPVAGQLDDAIVAALALRVVLRGAGPGIVEEHWPGPQESLRLVLRAAGALPGAPVGQS
jgi:uncharacterized membrane protein YkvA (DUF1232 family)